MRDGQKFIEGILIGMAAMAVAAIAVAVWGAMAIRGCPGRSTQPQTKIKRVPVAVEEPHGIELPEYEAPELLNSEDYE